MAPNRVHIGSWNELPDDAATGRPEDREKPRGGDARWLWSGSKVARRLAWALGACALLLAGGAFALTSLVDVEAFIDWVEPRASAALNRPVDVGGARFVLLPRPGIRLTDIRVGNLPDFDGPPLAAIDRLDLRVAFRPLLRGALAVEDARVQGIRLHAGIDGDGTSNFGDLVPEGAERTMENGPVRVAIRHVGVSDASLTWFDAPADRSMMALGTEAEVSVAGLGGDGGWRVRVEGRPDSLHLRTGAPEERILRMAGPTVALGARGDASGSTIEITEGLVRHAALSFKVGGRLEALHTPTPRLALTVEDPDLEAARLTSLLPARTRAEFQPYLEGSLALSLRLYGPLAGEGPRFTGSVELDDAGVRLQGEELARGLTGTVVIDRDSVRTQGLQGTVAGGPFDALATLERGTGQGMISVEAVPDLALLQRVGFLANAPELSGDAAVGLTLEGSLDSLDAARIRGRIELRGVRTEPARLAVPVYIPAAEFTVNGREISWTESEVLVGDDALISEGRLSATPSALWRGDADPEVEMSIRGEHLDLSEALPSARGPEAPTYPRIAFAHLADRPIDGRPARIVADDAGFRRPQAIPLRGSVRLDLHEVSYRELMLDSLSADLVLTDSTLTVTDADFGVWGGRMAGTLRLGAGDALDEPFALTLRGDSLDAASFLVTLTPVDEAIQGTLSITLELQGATDLDLMPVPGSLRGGTHLTLTDGHVSETGLNLALADFLAAEDWQDVPFTAWDTRLRFVDGAVEVEDGRLEGPLGTVRSRGTVGMDGAVDLSLGVSIPPEGLGDLSLRRTGVGSAVLRNLQDAGQPLVLGLRVAGSLDGPTMEPDALAVEEAGNGPGG